MMKVHQSSRMFPFCSLLLLWFGLVVVSAEHRKVPPYSRDRDESYQYQRREQVTTEIIGGSQVQQRNAYPFFVLLNTGCGGTLIAKDTVLTAAHCFGTTSVDGVNPGYAWINAYDLNDLNRDFVAAPDVDIDRLVNSVGLVFVGGSMVM